MFDGDEGGARTTIWRHRIVVAPGGGARGWEALSGAVAPGADDDGDVGEADVAVEVGIAEGAGGRGRAPGADDERDVGEADGAVVVDVAGAGGDQKAQLHAVDAGLDHAAGESGVGADGAVRDGDGVA